MNDVRVTDGVRTRDNRNHNPSGKSNNQPLSSDLPSGSGRGKSRSDVRSRPRSENELLAGSPVVITDGLLRGARGVVVSRAGWEWSEGIPNYIVDVDGVALLRTIRGDYLRGAA